MKKVSILILSILAISTAIPLPWVRKSPLTRVVDQQEEGPQAQWFEQELDHFSPDPRTWQQRYYVNSTFYKPGGPIFLQVGGEGAIAPIYVTYLEYVSYAETYGALLVALEHRFYGESIPLPDLSTPNLKYLSSDQALADLGHFIVSFKNSIGAPDAEVVTFGGSYPGNLAAWFRIKYPSLTVGAVASSAPVQATLDFYKYLDVVDRSLADVTGPKCNDQIALATTYLENLLSTGKLAEVERMFNTCTPFTNPLDIPTFMSGLAGNFMGTVQYDNEGSPITIQTLCDIMDNATEPIDGYIAVNRLMLYLYGENCTSISYEEVLEVLGLTNATIFNQGVNPRSWTYQTCAEFGYFQTTDSPNQPFGNMVPLRYYTQLCDDLGWNFTTRVNETNEKYGGNNPSGSTEILFVNGSLDPWHALSITETELPEIKTILINGTAHCANMLPATYMDPPGLAKAQKEIRKHIGTYLSN